MTLLQTLASVLMAAGGIFILIGGIGLLRLPNFYTRLHAAGVTDSLGTILLLGGLMLYSSWGLTTLKLMLILLFILLTSPTASHALAKAALHGRLPIQLPEKGAPPSKL